MIARLSAIALIGVACGGSAPVQDRQMCNSAIDGYNNAVSDISSRLRRYSSCVSGSQGNDDCSSEFRRLRSAQSDFESAVSQYRNYCQ
jgi:hypothetical protein